MNRPSAFHRSYRPLWDGPVPAPTAAQSIRALDDAQASYVAYERAAAQNPCMPAARRESARAALLRMGVADA